VATISRDKRSSEEALLDYVKNIRAHRKGWLCVYMHLSNLKTEHYGPFSPQDVAACFHPLVREKKGRLFHLSNRDTVFVAHNAASIDVETAVIGVQDLFRKDPVVIHDALVDWYDLSEDYQKFLDLCESLLSLPDQPSRIKSSGPGEEAAPKIKAQAKYRRLEAPERPVPHITPPTKPMRASDLDRLESQISITNPLDCLETRRVSAIAGSEHRPQLVFLTKRISFDKLRQHILPHCDVKSDPWLFEKLAQKVEDQLLQHFKVDDRQDALAISLPSNVNTVLSEHFDRFHRYMRKNNDRPVIIEFRLLDIMAHARDYVRARNLLKEKGYRVTIGGMDAFDFVFLNRRRQIADFEKIQWRDDYPQNLTGDWKTQYMDASACAGRGRLILEGCKLAEAVNHGKELGFSLFEGPYIESLYQNAPKQDVA